MDYVLSCEALDVLNKALCLEEEGHSFYERAAERTQNPQGSEMFRLLAKEAEKHVAMIERQIESLSQQQMWDLPECVFECSYEVADPPFPRSEAAFLESVPNNASDTDALLLALKATGDRLNSYSQNAQRTTDEQARQFYRYLAEQTRSQFDLLMLNYEQSGPLGTWTR